LQLTEVHGVFGDVGNSAHSPAVGEFKEEVDVVFEESVSEMR